MIEKLELFNFRCYDYKKIDLKTGINIIVGDNASGKSSLIEAIHVLGTCKSFRTHLDKDMIMFDKDFYSIFSIVRDKSITLSYLNGEKKINIDNNYVKTLSKYIGTLNVVLFSPEDLNIIKGEPKNRRKFIDVCLSQIDKEYLETLIDYNKILKERNELLKKIEFDGRNLEKNDDILLELYTDKLIEKAYVIVLKRKEFLEQINDEVDHKMKLMKEDEKVSLIYKPSVELINIGEEIKKNKLMDLYCKRSSVGPHKDDFEVALNNKNASSFSSQGQQRTITIAIKLAYAEILKKLNKSCIIMLDDVYGELDQKRQKDLIKMIDVNNQVIISTTTLDCIEKNILEKSNIIRI